MLNKPRAAIRLTPGEEVNHTWDTDDIVAKHIVTKIERGQNFYPAEPTHVMAAAH